MDQYAGRLKQLEEQLAALDADTSNQVLPPEVAAQRAKRSRGMGDLGMVAQVGGFEHLKGLGAQLARQAMADEELKVSNGGVYDPTSGQHTLFPGTVRENQRKRLEGEQGRVFLQQQRAQDTAERQQERFAQQIMLKGMLRAGRGGSGGGKAGGAAPVADDGVKYTTAAKTAAAKDEMNADGFSQMLQQLRAHMVELDKSSPYWRKEVSPDSGLLARAKGAAYAFGKGLDLNSPAARIEASKLLLAQKAQREADSNPTARQLMMTLKAFPGVSQGPAQLEAWLKDNEDQIKARSIKNQKVMRDQKFTAGASGSFDDEPSAHSDFESRLNHYAPRK